MTKLFLTNTRILDGDGSPAVEHGTIVIESPAEPRKKGYILYAGPAEGCGLKAEPGDRMMNMAGYTVLPGLFNVHVHLWSTYPKYAFPCDPFGIPYRTLIYYRHMAEALLAGVTTVRSVGGSDDIDVALRKALGNQMVWGPRLVTCGPPILPHGGHCHVTRGSVECSGPDEFVKAARLELAKGVDQIKLFYSGGAGGSIHEQMFSKHITDEEGRAVCDVVHMLGKKVVAHLSCDVAIRAALECGVDSVEHAYSMNEETAKMLAEKGAYYTPTLSITDASNCPNMRKTLLPHVQERLNKAHPIHMQSCAYAIKYGATICCGTDTLPTDSFDGTYATNYEMELLVEAGMAPLEAIKAATGNSADLCGLSDVTGRLKEGLEGDIIAVRGTPDQNIKDIRNLALVVRDCRLVWSSVPGNEQGMSFMPLPAGTPELSGTDMPW